MKKLYLVDVSSLFFRAYYAIPPLNTANGLPTNALYGFLNMTVKLLRDIKPDYIAFCFDRKEPSFRFDLYPEYKANRGEMPEDLVPQVPYVKKLTDLLGIPRFDKEGFEADDVIGSLTHFGREKDMEVIIVSGDKDFAQLIGPFVSMYDTMKDVKYDVDGAIEKWGVHPEQMIDFLAICGDSSDNVPGVRGVGPKGAQKMLAEFKTLEGIYENIEKIPGKSTKAKMEESEDLAYLSKELVTICTDIDFGIGAKDLKLKTIDKAKLTEALLELEFKGFVKSLVGGEAPNIESNNSGKSKNSGAKKKTPKVSFGKSKVNPEKITEKTLSLNELDQAIPAYSEVYGILNERGVRFGVGEDIYSVDAESKEIGKLLSGKMLSWKGFQLKELWHHIKMEKVLQPKMDMLLASYVARPGNIDGFDKVYELYSGKKVPDLATPSQWYSCYLELEALLGNKLESIGGSKVLDDIELPLVPILYEMEKEGILLDTKELEGQSKGLTKEIEKLEKAIHKDAGEAFNVASTKQLGHILFEVLGLTVIKKTKTGYSTSSDVLEKLKQEHPICEKVMEYRELAKLRSTYVDALPQLIDTDTNRIHTRFRQAATATGRLSSINPNLQNIPIRTERGRAVRKAFIAKPDHMLLSVDYSQIELRVLASITGDEAMCKAFSKDVDVHAATAAEVFNVPVVDVTPDLRRKAKAVNFGIAYGQGPFGLAESLGISRGEASEIIGNYFGRFRKVKKYMEDVVEKAKSDGYVETLFGRRRYIDELKSKNNALKKFGERAAINAPMQGTASDLVKMAMIKVYDEVPSKMLLQVHDELLLECEKGDVEADAKDVKDLMESVEGLKVPLKANVAWGKNWEEAHA